jgi:hypothetical protein
MNEFVLYLKLGLFHVLDWNAYDHIAFLIVLVASYTFLHWRRVLILVTLFTIGHTTSLILANYNLVSVSSRWVEFLIPITIIVGAIYNIFTAGKSAFQKGVNLLYFITLFFGLIHGFGFASYYKMIHGGSSLLPLLEFALGVEIAQIIIVMVALTAALIFQTLFRFSKKEWVLIISSVALGLILPLLIKNWIF